MQLLSRVTRTIALLGIAGLGAHLALEYGQGGVWRGLRAAHAVVGGPAERPYDLTELRAVRATLDTIRKKYVEPERINPRQMFLSALDRIQMEVAPVIVTHKDKSPTVQVQVFEKSAEFRVDNVQGPWDVAARLREVFAFIEPPLRTTKLDLAEVEYAAANGILRTLDPHSVFLSPEDYKDMSVSTSGHFGGLGIVISIRDQMLTVMRPMPGTPAGRAGLKRLDRIAKINSESTLNMPLEDAVDRLRGDPGSKVTVWVERQGPQGWAGSRPFELVREVIQVDSVEKQKLEGGVGYVRLKQFQQTTAEELSRALSSLEREGSLNALVLDLRDNPGGLLDQAGRVADFFLDSGIIYATIGHSEGRREQPASGPGTQPNYPIVVLVSGASASASEIVTGALRNQNRAVVLGETTFGKGSVQLVFPEITPEGAGLKLTIAQYLTPGDISIQGTGVVPDIQLTPMTADLQEMNLFADEDHYRERDLNRTLGAGGRRTQDPPTYSLRFNLPESVRATIRDRGSQVDDEFHVDGPIYLAREIASKMRPGSRRTQLESLKSTISALEERELSLVRADLQKMGIDWSPAPADAAKSPTPPTGLEVSLSTNRPENTARAGEDLLLSVTVKNTGTSPVFQLHAVAKSDTGYFDERELIFGKIAPGESKTATAPFGFCQPEGRKPGSTTPVQDLTKRVCRIPFDADTQQDAVRVELSAGATRLPTVHEIRPTIQSLPRPLFAYSVQVVDNRAANQNGQLERGEGATAYLRIKNIGEGATRDAQANLRNLTGEGLLLRAGRFDLGVMKPGEERDVEFTFDVLRALEGSEVRLQLSVSDAELGAGAGEKLTLPVVLGKNLRRLDAAQGTVTATRDLVVKDDPGKDGRILGTIAKGRVLERLGTVGEMTQVRLGPARFAFAETAALTPGGATPGPAPAWNHVLSHSPPELSVQAAELATRNTTIEISGSAKDELDGITDLVVFVGNQKVHYKPNAGPNKATLDFRVPVPLQPGTNFITVIARESEDIATRRTLVVRRDGPNGEILPTPKNHTFGENWEFDEP